MRKTAGGSDIFLGNSEKPLQHAGAFRVLVFPVDRLDFSLLEFPSFLKGEISFIRLLAVPVSAYR